MLNDNLLYTTEDALKSIDSPDQWQFLSTLLSMSSRGFETP